MDKCDIPDVILINPKRFSDNRGWFAETYNQKVAESFGIDQPFVQDNHSLSLQTGTLRGFHFQAPPHEQAKLVRCVRGRILDVAVDLRIGSPSYARYVSAELSAENGRQLFIPEGFAHAFLTLEPDTEVIYKVTDFYAPESDGGVRWNDETIAFPWPTGKPLLSAKDENLPKLDDKRSPFVYDSGIPGSSGSVTE